jgi:hypothetical protein
MRKPASCSKCQIMGHTRPTCKLEADRRRREFHSLYPATPDEIIQMKEEMTRAFTESAKGIAWREEQLLVAERARRYNERVLERQRLENVRSEERNRLRRAEERLERARQAGERLERARQGQPRSIGAAGGDPARASMPAPAIDPTLNHSLTQLNNWVNRVRREVGAIVATPRAPKSLSLKMVPSFENYTVEEECCICYDAEPIVGLPCKHTFCATCTSTTAKTRCICPMCRAEFSEIHIAQDIHPEQFNKVVAKIIIM